jgi:hypothetical protein
VKRPGNISPDSAGIAAVRLLCVLLLALWALPSSPTYAESGDASLEARVSREAPAVIVKRQTVAAAELKSSRLRKDTAASLDRIGVAGEASMPGAMPEARCHAGCGAQPFLAAPRTGKGARAPPTLPSRA